MASLRTGQERAYLRDLWLKGILHNTDIISQSPFQLSEEEHRSLLLGAGALDFRFATQMLLHAHVQHR